MSHADHRSFASLSDATQSPYDLIIIGGGPGGYVAAIRAAQLGLKTALVEDQHLGGICLNWGCIPTKALLKSASVYDSLHHVQDYGVHTDNIRAQVKDMVQRSRDVSARLQQGVQGLLKHHNIDVFQARGSLEPLTSGQGHGVRLDVQHTESEPRWIHAQRVIIATGARARTLFQDVPGIWTARQAMLPDEIPARLLIIGAGAIGVEFASFYRMLGTHVTLVESAPRLLPHEDADIASIMQQELSKQGIDWHSHALVSGVSVQEKSGYEAQWRNTETDKIHHWHGDRVLIAIGVVGNTEGLGLEHTAVVVQNGHIVTHTAGMTDELGVYAIGDVAGAPWLAHKASHEGVICVEHIAGHNHSHQLDISSIPGCIYSVPQVASIGMTENKALASGHRIKTGKFPFSANGQAIAYGHTTGMVKVIFDQDTGELLGAHMIGHGVSEMIQGLAVAKTLQATEEDLKRVIFPHPTMSEAIHEAILDADKMALHRI